MTLCTLPTMGARPTRRPGRPPSGKRLAMTRDMSGKLRSVYKRSLDPCDNSNDSGLGFENHTDLHLHSVGLSERLTWSGERAEVKRQRMDIKLENDEVNEGYSFPETIRTCTDNNISLIRTAPAGSVPHLSMNNNGSTTSGRAVPRCIPLSNRQSSSAPVALTTQLSTTSRYSDVTLMIVKQPEQQHRARYQTEGSRGAVKDRDGNGFPIVQLNGYYKPATLQVFIGTDVGKVAPHMFYQACKVSGKNSTPCMEKKIEGTCVIELQLEPTKEMSATCDCVGILKERNVDVEHRFPEQLGNRSKKKSTKCRMIFRTTITLEDGAQETLQVCSQPIVCTQPPGVPEISKKSLTSCPASGGLELFVLGKNFLKDTKVFFQQCEDGHIKWEQAVAPDKEYLQQTHFVCVVPQYPTEISEPVSVRLCVVSSGKTSEFHQFVYTPNNGAMPSVHVDPTPSSPFFKSMLWPSSQVSKREKDLDMMPPPESSLVPMSTRRSSISLPSTSEAHSPPLRSSLKQEYIDESSSSSLIDTMDTVHPERYRHISESSLDVHHGDSNLSFINENSMEMMQQHQMFNHDNSNDDSRVSSICENSLDINASNSNLSAINEDSCNSVMHLPPKVVESVMDLTIKLPMATVADLVNTTAPSMAALQRFAMINPSLPPQSAQSVENYLNRIETPIPFVTESEAIYRFSGAQSEAVNVVAKSEAAAIAEHSVIPEQTSPMTSNTITTSIETSIPTIKLDDLVNSTVESHIGSPNRTDATKSDVMIGSQDVMLSSSNSLMVPPIISTRLPSPARLSPDVMQSFATDALLSESQQQSSPDSIHSPIAVALTADPEKAVLLEATVDLLNTQKQICNMVETTSANIITNSLGQYTNTMMPKMLVTDSVIPIPVKDIATTSTEKKNDDRMIPQSFTSLTENELINLINPSCFDQV